MKKLLILLFSLLLSSPTVFAINVSLSCEAGQVSGKVKTLKHQLYDNIFPTIVINSQKKEVSYTYLSSGMRWDTNLKIIEEDESNIIAINIVDASWTDIFHFDKKEKTFSLVYVGDTGNTLNYGQCFD
jgi:hypothetical protein